VSPSLVEAGELCECVCVSASFVETGELCVSPSLAETGTLCVSVCVCVCVCVCHTQPC